MRVYTLHLIAILFFSLLGNNLYAAKCDRIVSSNKTSLKGLINGSAHFGASRSLRPYLVTYVLDEGIQSYEDESHLSIILRPEESSDLLEYPNGAELREPLSNFQEIKVSKEVAEFILVNYGVQVSVRTIDEPAMAEVSDSAISNLADYINRDYRFMLNNASVVPVTIYYKK